MLAFTINQLPLEHSNIYTLAEKGRSGELKELLGEGLLADQPHAGRASYKIPLLKTDTPLRISVNTVKHSAMLLLLEKGAKPDEGMRVGPLGLLGGWTPLSTAASMDFAGGVRGLIAQGARPNVGLTVAPSGFIVKNSPLYYAATKGFAQVVKELTSSGADVHQGWSIFHGLVIFGTPLFFAAKHGHVEVVQILLEAGADTSVGLSMGPWGILGKQSPFEVAVSNRRHACAKAIKDFLNTAQPPTTSTAASEL